MKKVICVLLSLFVLLSLCSCGTSATGSGGAETSAESQECTIGVLTYSSTSSESVAFHHYLNDYIETCFDGVSFLYSDSITSAEEEMECIDEMAAEGVRGILSFNSYDLKAEVEKCAASGIYYMMASGTVSDEEFASVADNSYFLGVVGPGKETEYAAGKDMALYFSENSYGTSYVILTGGAALGNEMHYERALGMLEALEEHYGCSFGSDASDLVQTQEVTYLTGSGCSVLLCPGYLDFEDFAAPIRDALESYSYDHVLSVTTASPVMDSLHASSTLGIVDCYTEENALYFADGKLDYLCGKYGSIIGVSFAAMYNAITGDADALRDNGKAFQLEQSFWSSSSLSDFNEKYGISSNPAYTAYSFEDITSVCTSYSASASISALKALAAACSYEDVCSRRGIS